MNSLSWMIYLIYVLPSFRNVAVFFTIVSFLGIVFVILWNLYNNSRQEYFESSDSYNDRLKNYKERKPEFDSMKRKCFFALILSVLVSTMIPERQGLVLIASSQVGEKIINSEKVLSVVDPSVELLKEWINKELKTIKDQTNPKG